MHHKKSELQIGKESTCISSDFHISSSSLYQKHPQISNISNSTPESFNHHTTIQILDDQDYPFACSTRESGAGNVEAHLGTSVGLFVKFKALLVFSRIVDLIVVKFKTLLGFVSNFVFSATHGSGFYVSSQCMNYFQVSNRFSRFSRHHLRLILLLSLPFFYFLVSHPTKRFLVDFLFAFSFSAALVVSVYLALPKLPSIRLFLARSLPVKLSSSGEVHVPVYWSIGSRPKLDKKAVSGCCVQGYRNGDVYEGEFHKGKYSGNGVYYYYMKGRYEGDWVDGKYDGYGVETWARGSRYRGQYRLGLKHGYGVFRFYTGDVYSGEWSNGQSHGNGVHTCEDGSRYVGEFKWGVKHGLGHYHFRNGDVYAGEYFADKMHGFGVYRFANGHCYEGAWHDGRRQGIGMYTFRNGEVQSGHWKDGVLEVPSTQNTTYPISAVGIYHSKVLNAVQEARGAAEKAYDVGKVDERVNRAVVAANKAANAARVMAVKAVHNQMHRRVDSDEIPYPIAP